MTTTPKCSRCGADLPNDAPAGVCPQCVLQQALGSGSETKAAKVPAGSPPNLAEIAQYFPQLEILEFIGAGGMGAVYKARQKQLNRVVGLKILPAEAAGDPSFAERFTREAQALAKLNHPNIIAVYDFGLAQRAAGETPAPLYYFIMEYVDGATLRQMERAGQLTPAEALTIVPKICDALQYAHDEGVVHRDIKPENILVDKKGRVKIADFGLAKLLGKETVNFTLTGSQQSLGTPHYMAPEQVEHPLTVDHRADIYSLGVVFYEMLTGELPMGRFALPSQTLHVDVRLDEVVLKTLEKEPDRRYQHVSEVKSAVESVVSQPAVAAKSKYRPAVLIAVALGVVLIATLVWWLSHRPTMPASTLAWRATLAKAEAAYDESRFEEAMGLFDSALAAMNADQKADPSVLKVSQHKAHKGRNLARFVLDRSKLPLPEQIELTQQKLAEFNTNYTGKGTFTATKDGQIIADLRKVGITDLTPLKGLPLMELSLRETPVVDLAPLKGMPLKILNLDASKVVDLSPLKGMTSLTNLDCSTTGIRDLGPLQGLPLKYLALFETHVSDLSPLKGMPLQRLWIERCGDLTDISPLKGMPLEYLNIRWTPVSDFRPLEGMPLVNLHHVMWSTWRPPATAFSVLRTLKNLAVVDSIDFKPLLNDLYTALRTNGLAQAKKEAASLIADCQSVPAFTNVVAEAREIQTALDSLAQGDTVGPYTVGPYRNYWGKHLNERGIVRDFGYTCDTNGLITIDLSGCLGASGLDALHYVPLRSVALCRNNITNLQALAGLPLRELNLYDTPVADLSPLRGMKLEVLNIGMTSVADLSPLKGMPLKHINVRESKVVDLSPLRGMTSLTGLACENAGIQDLGPLQGLKLEGLYLRGTPVTDLTPLKGMLLKGLDLWGTRVVDLSPLKGMTSLNNLICVSTGIRDLGPLQGLPLKSLYLKMTPVSDLAPLQGMPLDALDLSQTAVSDLRPLQGMPLKFLSVASCPVTDLSPLRTLKALALVEGNDLKLLLNDLYTALRTNDLARAKKEADSLIADCQSAPAFSNVVVEAREIQTALAQLAQGDTGPYTRYWWKHLKEHGVVKHNGYACNTNGLITIDLTGCLVSSNITLDALHYVPLSVVNLGGNNLTNLQALAGLPLTWLALNANPVADLSPLRGMKLESLNLYQTSVADLAPLKGMSLKSLNLQESKVGDLSPLRGMTSLTDLNCESTGIRDVGPLQGMPLKRLCLTNTKVPDLAPLQGMPLKQLTMNYCPDVTDISPLQGMPLTSFLAINTGIADLSPLAGMPLEKLELNDAPNITSITALRGMKLTGLYLAGTKVSDVTVLQGMPLKDLWLERTKVATFPSFDGMPLEVLRIFSTPATHLPSLKGVPLRHLNMSSTTISDLTPLAGLPLREVYVSNTPVADLSPLKGAPLVQLIAASSKVADLSPLKGAPLDYVNIDNTPVVDLSPLANAPIHELRASGTRVSDLAPLKNIPLVNLALEGTPVSDLAPLKNVPLALLSIHDTKVTDLSPLSGMSSLREFYSNGTPLSDLSPLKGMSLTKISIGGTKVRDLSPLKGMKSLTAIGDFDIAGILLADLRRAVEVKDNAGVRTLAPKLIADWQDVPAMAEVVKQAKEMLGAVGGGKREE